MDNVTNWWAICTECRHEIEPFDDRKTIVAEIVLHKIKTGHRLLLQGEVTKEVEGCDPRLTGTGKLV